MSKSDLLASVKRVAPAYLYTGVSLLWIMQLILGELDRDGAESAPRASASQSDETVAPGREKGSRPGCIEIEGIEICE